MSAASPERSFWGRLVVLGTFWGAAAWVGVAIIASVVITLYGRPPVASGADEHAFARQRAWCLRTLAGLRDELETELARELTRPAKGPALARFDAWNERWREELEDAAARCDAGFEPALADAYVRLRVLHEGYAGALALWTRARTVDGEALDRALRGLTGQRR